MAPSPRKRKTRSKDIETSNTSENTADIGTKNFSKGGKSSSKPKRKQHGLAAQDQVHRSRRNKMLIAVLLYIAIGVGILIWKGMTKLPEIPPELESEILGSYPQQLKDIDMPKNIKKKLSDSANADKVPDADNANEAIAQSLEGEQLASRFKEVDSWREIISGEKAVNSTVRVSRMDNFLSLTKCDDLIKYHEKRLTELKNNDPVICFTDESALMSHMAQSKLHWAAKITVEDFMKGTNCLNSTLSSQLKDISWSYSTSLDEKQGDFNSLFADVDKELLSYYNEGKLQITSYGMNVYRRAHDECRENVALPKPAVTALVFLENGGNVELFNLGTIVKPRKGTAILWNNISSKKFDAKSYHAVSSVMKKTNYLLQKIYYVGELPKVQKLPEDLNESTPRVMCGSYDCGSCWWYDDWN